MMDVIIGALAGLLMGVIFEEPLKKLWYGLIKSVKRRIKKPKTVKEPTHFTLGSETTSFIICDGDGEMTYGPSNIDTRLQNTEIRLPEELQSIRNQIAEAEIEKKEQGLSFKWNGPQFALSRYSINRTTVNEDMKVIFTFSPSDYYTFQSTVMQLDRVLPSGKTVRQTYLTDTNHETPVPFMANGFGVILTVLTSDNQMVLTRRSENSGTRAGQFDVSVVEAVHPSQDRSSHGQGPDLFKTGVRGAKEELGLDVDPSQISFLGFGLDEEYYQWNMIGIVHSEKTAQQIAVERSRGASGKWELEHLQFMPNSPKEIVALLQDEEMWSTAKIALYWSLVHEFDKRTVDRLIEKTFK